MEIKKTLKKLLTIIISFKFILFSISFSFSIYFLLILGTYAQIYVSDFGVYSCDNCFTSITNFTDIISGKLDIHYIIISFLVFVASVIYKKRLRIYITTLISTSISLTAYDVAIADKKEGIISYAIENLMFNTFGALFLSFFILLNLASINFIIKNRKASVLVTSLIPLTSSLIVCFIIYGYLYLIYERAPAHVDAIFSERLVGDIIPADEDSFGFLTTYKNIDGTTKIQSTGDNRFDWDAGRQQYDIHAYFFSGCILTPDKFVNQKNKPTAIIKDVSTLAFSTNMPAIYYAEGKKLSAQVKNAFSVNNNSPERVWAIIKDGDVKLKNPYHPLTILINVSPFNEDTFLNKVEYKLSVGDKNYTIKNNISTYKINSQKKSKCSLITSKGNTISTDNEVIGLASIALIFIPKGDVDFNNDSKATIKVKNGDITKNKNIKEPLIDFNNGHLKYINAIGLEALKINNRRVDVSHSDLLYATGDNLIGFITKDNKIKVFGTAEQVALNTKIMNLKPISILNNKLTYLNTSIGDILKVFIGMGLLVFASNYIIKFFKRKNRIDILK